jgi:hypothetical protein
MANDIFFNISKRRKEFEELLKEYRDYVVKNGFHLNPD